METEIRHPGIKDRQIKPDPPPAPPKEAAVALLQAITDALRAQMNLLAEALDAAPRQGADVDEPEGARYIVLSDTLARKLAEQIRSAGK